MSLGRKKNIDNALWLDAIAHIEEAVSRDEIDELEYRTVDDIKITVDSKNAAYGWSGGKDSLVLHELCRQAGITESVFVHTNLEYPAFLAWCLEHEPEGCEVINVGLDLEWLSKHPNMLFPQDNRTVYRWFQLVQQTGIRKYFKEHGLDMIVVGHRNADGNYTGDREHISRNNAGIVRYSPIASWSHEQLLAYIHYHNIAMPPIYEWEDGYKCGTHPWPGRMHTKSIEDGFRIVQSIDKSIIEGAAAYLPEARHFLGKEVAK